MELEDEASKEATASEREASSDVEAMTAEAPPTPEDRSMEELYEETFKHIQQGEILSGHIMQIERDAVLVDVGYKSEGYIRLDEFPNRGRDLKVGEEIDVFLERTEDIDGMIVLSKEKADRIRIWDDLAEAYDEGTPVKGRVLSRIKGGLTVDVGGLRGFLPGSQIDLRPVRNLEGLIGQQIEMKIIKLNRKRSNIVLSRRVLLEEVREEAKKRTMEVLEDGLQMEGVLKNITDYGAFIDLGGIDGLLHITDMAWGRISHPSELFAIGDTVEVVVLKFDPERERVSLGYKQLKPDPWDDVDTKYPVGDRVNGKVVSITDYGAFVELEQGVEGLVHVSEMSWNKRIRHASKVVSVGEIIEAVVLKVDREGRRISLGIKQTEPNPWETIEERYPVGELVEGRVRNLTDFGAFVSIEEGIDGLIHVSDISWTQVKDPAEVLRKGQKVEVKVLSVDKDQERLSLGLKQLTPDPWETVTDRYNLGDYVEGRVVKVTNFGAFAELEEGIEGLVHVSELATSKVANPKDIVGERDTIRAKIIKIDLENRKIGLSVKGYIVEEGSEGIIRAEPIKEPDAPEVEAEAVVEEPEVAVEEDAEPPVDEAEAVVEEPEAAVEEDVELPEEAVAESPEPPVDEPEAVVEEPEVAVEEDEEPPEEVVAESPVDEPEAVVEEPEVAVEEEVEPPDEAVAESPEPPVDEPEAVVEEPEVTVEEDAEAAEEVVAESPEPPVDEPEAVVE
ncbi:MAG: 30S ribosomal protein S1, partial [bacterium]|nr:30S ribosomal protein S1 [bacterium]